MPRKILIVDDNQMNRAMLSNMLNTDYDILETSNGVEALEIIRKTSAELSAVLLDIVMPEMDGYETLRRVRDSVEFADIPIIMVTGSEDEESRTKALSLGANDFILKPYNPDIVQHCVKNNIAQYDTARKLNAMQKDKLTGLLSREAFFERISEMIPAHEPGYYILSCFDIDNFKLINVQFGTLEGDRILRQIGKTVADDMAEYGGIGGRIGGDNFAVLLPSKHKDVSISRVLIDNRLAFSSKQTIVFSVGRYHITDLTLLPTAMYDRAYIAKQSVKGSYDSRIAYFDESMLDRLVHDQQIVADIDIAIAHKQFEVWFQPQINHMTGALAGAEALVRWRHPQKGLISPGEFIPIFEQNGFIYELDRFVWEETCAHLRKWIDGGKNPVPISVNISRQDLFRPDFTQFLSELIKKYGLSAELLRLEITESAFAQSTSLMVEIVKQLIAMGFTVEIDDFGSGYSSLNTLKSVPAQVVKLDMRFLEDDAGGERGGNILSSIVRMAKWLGMSVIAEGVEEKSQADYLASIGCSYIQGYYYSRPLCAEDFEKYCVNLGKEPDLHTMNAVEHFDNNSLWDPKSMDALIFSSYVGGACIFEYYKGQIELLRANRKFAAILGDGTLSIEDTLKLGWMDCLAPESRELVREVMKRSLETKEEYTNEYLFYNIPGAPEKTYLRGTMRVIAASGDRWLVYCTSENITAQREAEENERRAIMNREMTAGQMQAILDNVDVGIVASVLKDEIISILFANEKYYELLGYTKEQFLAEVKDPYSTFPPEDLPAIKENFRDYFNRGEAGVREAYMLRRDGTRRLMRITFSISRFVGIDQPVQLSIFRDITEERATELKERRAKEQIEAVMRGVSSGIIAAALNDSGIFELLFSNERYYELFGYTREQYDSEVHDPFLLIHPDDREKARSAAMYAYTHKQPAQLEYRVICRDGSVRWLRVDVSPASLTGVSRHVNLCVLRDITAAREADRKLLETDEQLSFLVSMSNELLAHPDTERGVNAALRRLLEYFGASRAYIFEFDTEHDTTSNTYEICGEGITPQIGNLKRIPLSLLDSWITAFGKDGYYSIEDIGALDESRAAERELLLSQDITSLLAVPLRRDGKHIGMIGLDDPQRRTEHHERLVALGDYIAVMLTRRDLERRISKDNHDLTTMMDDMPGGFVRMRFVSDGSLVPFFHNEGFCRLTGMDDAQLREVYSGNPLNGVHPEDHSIVKDVTDKLRVTGKAASSRYRIRHRDGSYIWVSTFGRITTDAAGETVLNAYFLDATEQVRKEEMLKSLMDNMPCGAGIYEFTGSQMSMIYQNKIYWELVGLNEEAYPDTSEMSAVHPDDIPVLMQELSSAISQHRDVNCDIRLRHLTLGYRSVHLMGRVVPKESGGLLIYATFTPISEVVMEAQRQQARLALLTNSIPGGIAVYEGQPDALDHIRLTYFSDGFPHLFGYSREEYEKLSEINPLGLVAAGDKARMYRSILDLVNNGIPLDIIYLASVNGGGTRWINVKAVMGEPNGDMLTVNAVFVNVTEQKEAMDRLRVSEEVNRLAIQQSMGIVCQYDIAARRLTVPDNVDSIFEAEHIEEDIPYRPVKEGRVSPETVGAYIAFYESILSGNAKGSARFQRFSTQGWRWIEAHFTTIFTEDQVPVTAVITLHDVTDSIEKETAYRKWKQSIKDKNPETYSLYRCSITKSTVLEESEGELVPEALLEDSLNLVKRTSNYADVCVCPEDRQRFLSFMNRDAMLLRYSQGRRTDAIEYRERLSDGGCRWLRLSVDFVDSAYSSEVEAYMLFENIDGAKRAELEILERAEKDQLTGLLNRSNFIAKVEEKLNTLKSGTSSALFIIDLDGFRLVNDHFGHAVGDQTLIEIAQKLSETFSGDDLVCRLGGDEFMVYMGGITYPGVVRERAALLCALIHKSFSLEVQLSASIGISVCPENGTDFDTLYRKADAALYHIKGAGRDAYALYTDNMTERRLSAEDAAMDKPVIAVDAYQKPRPRMLIVDDSEIGRNYLAGLFQEDYLIDTAAEGTAALIRLNRYGAGICVVLLDLMMPGMDGFEMLRRMRESVTMQNIPVIVVSGMDERETALQAIKAGASDYITKPVDADLLKFRVSSAISKAENEKLRAQNRYLAMQNDEAKRLAEARRHSEELSVALHAAEKADLAKSQFLSSISHEIRTPLNAVIGYNTIARSEISKAQTDDERKQASMRILDCLTKGEVASRHLLTIINDVLDISAIESGKLKVDSSPFDFRSLITSLTVMFYSQARAKGVDFEVLFDKPAEEWFIGDQLRINQVLTNLLSNAVKFTPEGGKVTLSITEHRNDEHDTTFSFTVSDTGIGMTQEYLSHIWTPFEQAEASISRRFGGSGLGLSITKNLVELMGGTIAVQSKSGVGSKFTVGLTLVRTEQPKKNSSVDFSSINALVVDDDYSTCDYIKLLFDRCGAKCTTFTSGQQAITAFSAAKGQGTPFNMCLVDWRMPTMDGFTTISEIRRIAAKELPIVVVTAYDFDDISEYTQSLEISKFIAKPLFQSTLYDLLATVCGRRTIKGAQEIAKYNFDGARVLLVEDNNMNMEVAKHLLLSANLAVDCAWNGQEAFDIFSASKPGTYKAVLMDIHMPVVDGYQATRMIRSAGHPDAANIPIIATTADVFAKDIEQAHDAGMNGHISKPLDAELLLSMLAEYIGKK